MLRVRTCSQRPTWHSPACEAVSSLLLLYVPRCDFQKDLLSSEVCLTGLQFLQWSSFFSSKMGNFPSHQNHTSITQTFVRPQAVSLQWHCLAFSALLETSHLVLCAIYLIDFYLDLLLWVILSLPDPGIGLEDLGGLRLSLQVEAEAKKASSTSDFSISFDTRFPTTLSGNPTFSFFFLLLTV